ncbi:diaminopimelate decarboxylase [Peptoniphilus catoniae]|uniref:diaminopimelate decarboxylase n=1 Tax=Peptoniphilus catoniae TaxID=1660341 RepID=UPI0010FF00F9|nr:diaminopimelate decarboxylase [Peptoniphilus catoniae]
MFTKKDNILHIDGVSVTELKKEYGTPLYIYSVNDIKDRISELKKDFLNKYENTTVSYAAKAFICKSLLDIIAKEGLNLDVVSSGELYIALASGFDPKKIEFNGNNKLYEEIDMAVKNGVGKIIVDGSGEVEMIERACKKYSTKTNVLFRITPGVDTKTHKYIQTAMVDSKFGFNLIDVLEEVKKLKNDPFINFIGYHYHLGSQLFDNTVYLKATDIAIDLIEKTKDLTGSYIKELNIGGGFGINYTDEKRKPYSYFLDPVMEKLKGHFADNTPSVTIEPGRSIVGEAGSTLYTVGNIKDIKGIRKYVALDGGMTDNIRPALYGAKYTALVANKTDEDSIETVTLCGKCCESGDILIKDIKLPQIESEDLILIKSTGAYGFSMSSNYNSLRRPAVVFTENSNHYLAVKRQDYKDLAF